MKENIVSKYRHTALFYLLSTLVPWAFWFAASYVSHHLIDTEGTWVASLLGLIGLCFPMVLTLMLVLRSGTLRKDFFGRFSEFVAQQVVLLPRGLPVDACKYSVCHGNIVALWL